MEGSYTAAARRTDRICVLLDTHDLPYDSLTRDHAFAETPAGFAEPLLVRYRCGVCAGQGCAVCSRGSVLVSERDRYDTGNRSSTEGLTPTVMPTHELDRELERLQAEARERAGVEAALAWYGVLRRAQRRDSEGSYAELRRALDRRPAGLDRQATVTYLVEAMPRVVRVPRWAHARERERLRGELESRRRRGATVDELASEYGLPRRQVRGLLRDGR